ncbi:MAG: hypothetical protein GDA56_26530 [Hormoscilla sp. GM7CHS1pb]|nr:hypothetical protein [Hormoscilla sp. GM7CHS1pb]
MNKARLRGLDYKSERHHPISHLTLLTGQRSPSPFLPLCANAILLYNGCSALGLLAAPVYYAWRTNRHCLLSN